MRQTAKQECSDKSTQKAGADQNPGKAPGASLGRVAHKSEACTTHDEHSRPEAGISSCSLRSVGLTRHSAPRTTRKKGRRTSTLAP